jgi:putrescine transport system permease protein
MRARHLLAAVAAVGFLFLYLPIVSLIIYSFNESRLVTVWTGFSFRWYGDLFRDAEVLAAAWISLKIGVVVATLATALGTLTALALVRAGAFRGRAILSALVAAPVVMPEVILGIGLLLLFVAAEQVIGVRSGRGSLTVVIAQSTFALAFVTVVVQARLVALDRGIEEAAADLGARPWQVLRDVTLPALTPALVSGWLLAFTLSLDDLVLASFVAGVGEPTLPMLIFSRMRLGVSPAMNALATLMILAVAIGAAIAWWRIRKARHAV